MPSRRRRTEKGAKCIEAKAREMSVSTVTETITPLVLRAEAMTTTFHFANTTPLGILFALSDDGQLSVHSFCEVSSGVPGPADYCVLQGPKRDIRARDVLLQVNDTQISKLPLEQRLPYGAALVGPVTLQTAPTFLQATGCLLANRL